MAGLVSCLMFVIFVVQTLRAQDDFLEERLVQDARQVTCQHPPTGLVVLRLEEVGDVTRTAVVNLLDKTCSGNITFHACNISATSVQAVITDLQDGDLRTFTCVATTLTGGVTHTKVIAEVNVTKTGDFLRQGPVQDARQVTCQHPPTGLVVLRLQEVGDVTRTAVVNLLDKTCSGNITFHACNISAASVQVVITDLQDGDLRTFTCVATTLTGGVTYTEVIAELNVTKTGETTQSFTNVPLAHLNYFTYRRQRC